MKSRLLTITPVHGMKKLKDLSKEPLRGDEMIDWMSTASIEICEDLIDSAILKIWAKSREGIMIHLQNDTVTPTSRFRSKELFQEAGREMQQHMPQTMLTLCTHQIFVELDYQIDQTCHFKNSFN